MKQECECSDDHGPCEDHCETLVVRQGASHRTADSLALLLCYDLIDCGATASSEALALLEEASAAESAAERYGVSWFCDDDNGLMDALVTLADELESAAGVSVFPDDGYTIVRLTEDCPIG